MEGKRGVSPRTGAVKTRPRSRKGKGNFELRSVIEEGEYVVALVGKEGGESGTPICEFVSFLFKVIANFVP